jgi:hypothetical protein
MFLQGDIMKPCCKVKVDSPGQHVRHDGLLQLDRSQGVEF